MKIEISRLRELLEDDEMGWGPWDSDEEFVDWLIAEKAKVERLAVARREELRNFCVPRLYAVERVEIP